MALNTKKNNDDNKTPPQDRAAYLRDVLKYPITQDNLISVVWETARLLLWINDDLASLPALHQSVSNLNNLFIDFMTDQLTTRANRELKEHVQASVAIQRTDEILTDTKKKIQAIEQARETLAQMEPLHKSSLPKFLSWEYLREKVAPSVIAWMVIGALGFVFYGLYLAVKAQLTK